MTIVLRALALYVALWLVLRLSGKRTMAEMTPFDFVLILMCGEATQQALVGQDYSFTAALAVILTLVTTDRVVAIVRARSKGFERIVEGLPVVLISRGVLIEKSMRHENVDEHDILEEARTRHGLASLDQIEHAILEPTGEISIIPRAHAQPQPSS